MAINYGKWIDPKKITQKEFNEKYLSFKTFVIFSSFKETYFASASCYYVPSLDDVKSRDEMILPIKEHIDGLKLLDFRLEKDKKGKFNVFYDKGWRQRSVDELNELNEI